MALLNTATNDEPGRANIAPHLKLNPENTPEHSSAVSWGAIFAGAAAAAALSLILLMLGLGLGLSAVSPWRQDGITATAFGVSTILWLTFTQLVASGMGGYLAGRLRTKWQLVHTDEVYFRDTAHGFLAWAVASLATAALLTSVIGSIIGGGIQAGSNVAGGAATGVAAAATGAAVAKSDGEAAPMGYFVDSLFRNDTTTAATTGASTVPASEVNRIIMNSIRVGALPAEDVKYLGQVVARHTGLTQADAEKRVADTYTRMQTKARETEAAIKDAADKARKASAYAALWLFISLLIGAFFASLGATYGGRRRDA